MCIYKDRISNGERKRRKGGKEKGEEDCQEGKIGKWVGKKVVARGNMMLFFMFMESLIED